MIKSRAASQGHPPTPPQSIEAVRRRARHRLIGASVLVLVGVVGFSLLFDTQPRPIAVDIPIEIPAKAAGARPASAEAGAAPPKTPEKSPDPAPAETVAAAPVAPAPAATRPAPAPPPADPPPVLAPAPAPPAPAVSAPATPSATESAPLRLVVQVGAFAEASRAREVRLKIEAAGMKTYTHVAETSEGRRIRVRLGPFSNRAEAERAATRVKALGYPAAILTL